MLTEVADVACEPAVNRQVVHGLVSQVCDHAAIAIYQNVPKTFRRLIDPRHAFRRLIDPRMIAQGTYGLSPRSERRNRRL